MLSTSDSRDWKPLVSMGVGASCLGGRGGGEGRCESRGQGQATAQHAASAAHTSVCICASSLLHHSGCTHAPHLHGTQHAPHSVCDELRGCRQLVVLLAAHLHHLTPLPLVKGQEGITAALALLILADAHTIKLQVQPRPAALAWRAVERGTEKEGVNKGGDGEGAAGERDGWVKRQASTSGEGCRRLTRPTPCPACSQNTALQQPASQPPCPSLHLFTTHPAIKHTSHPPESGPNMG